ncbi:uncharacterized protein LOC122088292 [Macadamia integrifolia]|uniref:uncharacterized protein LOC122088292 n=1 Tax=Macadamia integrifolia TaxID=60698 RepID=UPI001C4E7CB4|nr:uncharacterized protein LOC122088292 [Macadamia integrifolia]
MVILRSTCLVLGLLFTSLALRSNAVHAQQDADMTIVTNENGIVETGANAPFVSRESFKGVPGAAAATANKRLGGRKMVVGSILMKNMMEVAAVNGKTPKISGEDRIASEQPLGTSQKYMTHQKSSNLKPVYLPDTMASQLKSQDSEAVSNCGSLECSSRSRKLVSQESHDHLHKTESKKLLEVTNQIVNLIHRDYSGMNSPRRKPPINNHKPSRQSRKP